MQGAQHAFGQVPTPDGVRQLGQSGNTQLKPLLFAADWSYVRMLPIERVKRMCGILLRWSARSIYLSPLLILLRIGPRTVGDAGVVIVVTLAIIFFAILNVFVATSLFAYRARKHVPQTPVFRAPFSEAGADVLGLLQGGVDLEGEVAANQVIRVRGTIRGLHGVRRGSVVLRDLWWFDHDARLTESVDFLIERADEPPILLRYEVAPVLVAAPDSPDPQKLMVDRSSLNLLPFSTLPPTPCQRVQLRDGDEVEVMGQVERIVDNVMTLGVEPDASGPYRGQASRPGIVIRSAFHRPVCLRIVRASFA